LRLLPGFVCQATYAPPAPSGAIATSDDASTAPDLDVTIDGTLLQPATIPPRQVVFISFSVTTPVELLDFAID